MNIPCDCARRAHKEDKMNSNMNRRYKDRLFCSIFQEKKELLSLYNAINGTDYCDEEVLTISTLDNAIYMTMKNDVSFLIYGILNLYEHQSTWNPNMPLRDFLYVSQQIRNMVEENEWDIYGSKLVKIPTPQAVVFYNGKKNQPERQILKLSDAYENKKKQGCMEFECLVLNINYGNNKEIMEKCKCLMDYAILIERIRNYEKREKNLEKAVDRAIEECIAEGVLADYLRLYRSGVKDLILSEYDEQKHIENEKRWSYEEGIERGYEKAEILITRLYEYLLQDNRQEEMRECFNDKNLRHRLMEEYGLLMRE